MPKKVKNSKKPGRREVIGSRELLDRYRVLKQFLENNWGRIGRELQRVRQPEDVRSILKLVPGVEWCSPFRDYAARCLLADGTTEVGWRELSLTRQQQKEAIATERHLFSEYHGVRQRAEEATTALKAFVSQFGTAISLFPFFLVVALVAKELGVEELTNNSNRLEASLRQAQKEKQALHERLSSQEAWYARNEVVKFTRSRRYEKTPTNFAQAMAGLPKYGWLHSLRKCETIQCDSAPSTCNYRIFELLKTIVRRMKPLTLTKVEESLRDKLLQQDADPLLRAYIAPNWAYMRQALAECRGKRFKRAELPYKIMGRFLANVERPKTITELELAKRDQLV